MWAVESQTGEYRTLIEWPTGRYCEVAAKRLQQSVLPLEIPA